MEKNAYSLSRAKATLQTKSLSSRLMSRTPWVARPLARTCFVLIRMTFPLTVTTSKSSSPTPNAAMAGPILGVTLRLRTPFPPRLVFR